MEARFVNYEQIGLDNLLVCLDADFWQCNKYEILDYIRINNGAHIGDRIFWFNNDCDRTMFLLKWN
jgi:hypothetical protein